MYSQFLDAFEEKPIQLHSDPQTTYDAIATSTPTAKYILDDLLSRLRRGHGLQVDHYLLDQLPLSDHETHLPDSVTRVLILTDVISTGTASACKHGPSS